MTLRNQLINGEQLRAVLEHAIKQCDKKLTLISAYITQSALDWLKKHVPDNVEVHLICRLLPSDVIQGSTNLSALETAINLGWKTSCLHSLHAKIYLIDSNIIYVGSANLTSNGLRIYGMGNIEACTSIPPNHENLQFIYNIETSSSQIDLETLKKMESFIEDKAPTIHFDEWPEGTLPIQEGIWVRDFFWHDPKSPLPQGNEKIHDLEILGIEILDQNKDVAERIFRSRCIQWLTSKLEKSPENELYFGNLTRLLHEDLKDDPAPYRKDVKSLVQNLLAYCTKFIPDKIEVSRPNHSQKIKLLMTRQTNL